MCQAFEAEQDFMNHLSPKTKAWLDELAIRFKELANPVKPENEVDQID